MTDDLDHLRATMKDATPRPDPARRAANLTLAQENFDALQGSQDGARLTSANRPKGLFSGVFAMLDTFSGKAALGTTTALVACGVLFLTPVGREMWQAAPRLDLTETAPEIARRVDAETATRERSVEVAVPEAVEADTAFAAEAPAALNRMQAAPSPADDATAGLVAPAPAIEALPPAEANTESYPEADDNPLKITAEEPVSTFSIDVDTASYGIVRSYLQGGQLPPRDAVRIEEMVNYFPYDYPSPAPGEAPFRPTISVGATPWNPDTQLVHLAIQGEMPTIADRPPLNLVFLIDTSGSMDDPAKLPLLRQSLMMMLDELRPEDEIAIVAYAGSAGEVLAPTPARERDTIRAALDNLRAGGSTNGLGGLEQAYATAAAMASEGEVGRIILATDGDFNVGLSDPAGLTDYIADQRDSGTYLSVLGFGRGNLDDATMQALAQNGNGQAAYIDTLSEARKVLVDQLTGALFPIAGDVKVQVEFNPATVAEYRLIGYETRALNREDFNDDRVDAGELGAGHSVTAIYEITPVGSPARLSDPLRYATETDAVGATDELGFLKLRYKEPGETESRLIETPIPDAPTGLDGEASFAAAIAGFGLLMRESAVTDGWSYSDAAALANAHRGADPFGYRFEAVRLMQIAEALAD